MTDRANLKALHQQRQGRGRTKQVLLTHPNMEETKAGLKTRARIKLSHKAVETLARLRFVLKAETRGKMVANSFFLFVCLFVCCFLFFCFCCCCCCCCCFYLFDFSPEFNYFLLFLGVLASVVL